MNFLAIDTSNEYLTVVASKEGKAEVLFEPQCGMQHSVRLMPAVEETLQRAGLSPAECDFFCAVTGPGSFTGIRIGISAAKGFALAECKPLLPLTSFELIAYNVDCEDFFAVVDAAHGHSYACRFTGGAPGAPAYVSDEELVASGLPLYGFEERALPRYKMLNAGGCLLPAITARLSSGEPFGEMHALYVRRSQAEEGRK